MVISEDGKEASTEFSTLKSWDVGNQFHKESFSELDVQIHTGRTHQIRIHLAHLSTPIVGDPIYSSRTVSKAKNSKGKAFDREVPYLLLASKYLEFVHPKSKDTMKFQIELPSHIRDFIKRLEENQIKS